MPADAATNRVAEGLWIGHLELSPELRVGALETGPLPPRIEADEPDSPKSLQSHSYDRSAAQLLAGKMKAV
jgi:hypothetical protein